MHVGLNLLFIIPGENGGTQVYSESLIRALADLDSENQYTIFVSEEGASLPLPVQANFCTVVCAVRASRRGACFLWQQMILPWQMKLRRIDVMHTLGGIGPIFPLCPQVATVHDVNFIEIPFVMSRSKQMLLRRMIPAFARRSVHVLTVSEFSKERIEYHMHIPSDRISITYLGPREYIPVALDEWAGIAARYGLAGPFLIAFGSLAVHKNIARLVEAFTGIQAQVTQRLVLAGHMAAGSKLREQIEAAGLQDRIVLTGYLPDAHVMPMMEHADLFVFPSLHEGFGIPLVEAQRAGVAVASSTAGALPEVAGDGAAFFDPLSVPEMQRVLLECLSSADRRSALAHAGKLNVARFSWTQAAAQTLQAYTQAAGTRRLPAETG